MPLGFVIHPHFQCGLCGRELTTEKSNARACLAKKSKPRPRETSFERVDNVTLWETRLFYSEGGDVSWEIRGGHFFVGCFTRNALEIGTGRRRRLIFQGNFEGSLLWLLDL